MYTENITNICLDKYYNELILLNCKIDLKNVNYSKNIFIIKKIVETDISRKLDKIYNYNLFENICINGNYRMVKWLCLKFKFDKKIIFYSCNKIIIFNKNYYDEFIEKYIFYAIKNNNLKMLKFGSRFEKNKFLLYINLCASATHNNIKILKWILKNDDLFNRNKNKKYKNFNINTFFDKECDKSIRFISKYSKVLHLSYKIYNLNEKKYKILIWLLLNTKISRYDIEFLSWGKNSSIIEKKIYELLYSIKGEIYFDLFKNNINYIKNTMFIKK